jgi:hypothetical protein
MAKEKLLNISCSFETFFETSIKDLFVLFNNISRLVGVLLKRKKLEK